VKIAIDMSTFRLRRVAIGLLLLSGAVIVLVARVTGALGAAAALALSTRGNEYFVFRRREEVLRRIRKPLDLLDFPYSIEGSTVAIVTPPMTLRLRSFGFGSLLSFRFPRPPSARERYIATTLIKYQRTIRKSG
jgi:hypothetical protein